MVRYQEYISSKTMWISQMWSRQSKSGSKRQDKLWRRRLVENYHQKKLKLTKLAGNEKCQVKAQYLWERSVTLKRFLKTLKKNSWTVKGTPVIYGLPRRFKSVYFRKRPKRIVEINYMMIIRFKNDMEKKKKWIMSCKLSH